MLLAEHGGIWLDVDTVILDSEVLNFFSLDGGNEAVFFGNPEMRSVHLAAIMSKPSARCMRLWVEYIRDKIQDFNPPQRNFWAYFGNSFINIYAKTFTDEIKIIPRENAMPDISAFPALTGNAAYLNYYFLESRHLDEISQNILLLHNSWTPAIFRNMGREDLMSCDCTMSNILSEILGLDRSRINRRTKFERWSWRNIFRREFALRV